MAQGTENKSTNGRSLPPWLPWARLGFRTLGTVWPEAAANVAELLWLTPSRLRLRPQDAAVLAKGSPFRIPFEKSQLTGWRFGRGRPVYLVHGWGGHAGQLTSFVQPLVEQGFQVIAFDLPAHGGSGGTRTSAVQMANAVPAVAASVGPPAAVVAHSFGAVAVTLAQSRGLGAERLVYIAAPSSFDYYAQRFTQTLGISSQTWARVQSNVERRLETRFQDITPVKLSGRMEAPLLLVHDRGDPDVPFSHGEALAQSWPGAELMETTGLGHYKILRAQKVIFRAQEFLGAIRPPERMGEWKELLEARP